jgi:hypothetical protein
MSDASPGLAVKPTIEGITREDHASGGRWAVTVGGHARAAMVELPTRLSAIYQPVGL